MSKTNAKQNFLSCLLNKVLYIKAFLLAAGCKGSV